MSQETTREGEQPENKKPQTTMETIVKGVSLTNPKTNNSHREGTISTSNTETRVAHQSPAVPLSLYREVATELESTKTKLSTIRDEHRRLKHQNQILKREIQYLLRSTPNKRRINRSFLIEPQKASNLLDKEKERIAKAQTAEKATDIADRGTINNFVSKMETPVWIAETGQNFPITSRSHRVINGWLLALLIVLIVGTAFTAGFFLVRPLIDSPSESNSK
jgi:hypothetical protein